MKKRYYILTAVISYLFFTLSNIPAEKIISLAEEYTQLPVKLYGVHGSLWNGGADKAILQGQPSIDNIEWSINPAMLLLAQLNAEVKASIKNQNIIGNINISVGGSITASDIRTRIDAAVMQELIQMPLGELDGIFNVDIKSLEIKQEGLPIINGELAWENAKLTLLDTVDLGSINLLIESDENDQLVSSISNTKGQLSLKGKVILETLNTYNINFRMIPNANATENIRQSIDMLAKQKISGRSIMKRQNDGSYLIKRKGSLRDLGL